MQTTINQNLKKLLTKAYAPYSGVKVSAIVILKDGQTYSGFNIENAALTPGICAERCAIYKAISETDALGKFQELHLLSSTKKPLFPCGVCLQVMSEFFDPEMNIFIHNQNGAIETQLMFQQLMPFRIKKDDF